MHVSGWAGCYVHIGLDAKAESHTDQSRLFLPVINYKAIAFYLGPQIPQALFFRCLLGQV